jgi:hypothetical protein
MYWILLICAVMIPLGSMGQSTFDLTSAEPDVIPAGVTLEWHSAIPVNASNIYATPEMAAPGIYYAVFNYGNGCYSTPSPIRVGKTSCPSPTIDLTQFADETLVPTGTEVTYHTAVAPSDANRYTGDPAAAPAGRYYLAYRDQAGACYSNATPLVVLSYLDEPAPLAVADSSLNNMLGTAVSVVIIGNDTLSNHSMATPASSIITLTTTNLPAGSTLNGDGTVTVPDQGTWSLNASTAEMTFLPMTGYNRNPSPLTYTLTDNSTCKTTEAVVKITYAGAMPVTLISFKGKVVENQAVLEWQTASEINASHFEIQRSANAKDFTAIANVAANNSRSIYQFNDKRSIAGHSYYRLKMIDLDSTFAYSKIINLEVTSVKSLFAYPNPASRELMINSPDGTKWADVAKVEFFDPAGRMRYSTSDIKGQSINIGSLANGLYLIRIITKDGTAYHSRIVVKK